MYRGMALHHRADVTAVAPVKYAVLSEVDPEYLVAGVATARFRVACARYDYDFVVFADDWEKRQRWREDKVAEAVAVARRRVRSISRRSPYDRVRVVRAVP